MAHAEPDFSALFAALPGCYLVLLPDLTIVAVSDAYLTATLTTREGLLGRRLFDVFPDNPDDPAANGVRNLAASLERVLAERATDRMPIQKYDIRREGDGFEERYWSPVNQPVLGSDGEVRYIIHVVDDVTEMVRLERRGTEQDRELKELAIRGEESLRRVLDAAPVAMLLVDGSQRIRFVNARTERLFGYTNAELLASELELLLPERARSMHLLHVRRYFERPTSRTMGSGFELTGRCKDGRELPLEVSLSPLPLDGEVLVIAAMRDVSERIRLSRAANLNATRLVSAVESIQDAFALFDETTRLVLCNTAFRRLIAGSTPGAVIGRRYDELLEAWSHELELPDEEARAAFRAERVAAFSLPANDIDVRTRDGRTLRIIDRRTPDGGLVKTVWDLTEDARLAEELREARATAEKANAAKSEFLSSMSHELRTPLNAILGFSQLLQRDKNPALSEKQRAKVDQVVKGGEHLLRLIEDVLDLSRIEAGRMPVSLEPLNVLELLDEVEATLEPSVAKAGIRLERAHAPAEVPLVLADRTRIAQILMNFGSNAVKYNRPQGRLAFAVSLPSPRRVRITVSDDGIGIPEGAQAALFQPFQRAGQETGPIEGTGIGLAITKRLAELMGGSVGFHSVQGQGSTFWVDLNVSERPAPAASARASSSLPAPAERPRARVLYIEDNPANVSFMRHFLTELGIELVVARSAEEGIRLAREGRFALAILDINLPGMDGVEALHALRSRQETHALPVIALTAAATPRDRQRGEAAGFYRYLTKPISVPELEAALMPFLR